MEIPLAWRTVNDVIMETMHTPNSMQEIATAMQQEHALAVDERSAVSDVVLAMETSELYRLSKVQAQAILQELRDAMEGWRDVAQRCGLSGVEVTRMESVILDRALGCRLLHRGNNSS